MRNVQPAMTAASTMLSRLFLRRMFVRMPPMAGIFSSPFKSLSKLDSSMRRCATSPALMLAAVARASSAALLEVAREERSRSAMVLGVCTFGGGKQYHEWLAAVLAISER